MVAEPRSGLVVFVPAPWPAEPMEGLTGGLRGSLDGSDGLTGGYAPGFGEIPLPDFSRRRRTRGVTFGSEPGRSSSSGASMDSHVDSVELSSVPSKRCLVERLEVSGIELSPQET